MIDYDAHDWYSHLCDVRGSMVRQIIWRVLSCVVWSALVVLLHRLLLGLPIEALAPTSHHGIDIPSTVHGLVGFSVGLLLVFRTNASYDRFWEGRKMWGAIINETRNLARLSCTLLAAAPDLRDNIIRWTICWPYCVMQSLRSSSPEEFLASRAAHDEYHPLLEQKHVPLAVALRISKTINEARERNIVSDYLFATLDNNVQLLIDYMGACERIHRTPLPFAYVVHLRRALILYCYSLPIVLVAQYGWWTVPATFMTAYIFFGIEEIGVQIEDPFGYDENDLPLERFCEIIESDLTQLIEKRNA